MSIRIPMDDIGILYFLLYVEFKIKELWLTCHRKATIKW
jgi:hypothetical protein